MNLAAKEPLSSSQYFQYSIEDFLDELKNSSNLSEVLLGGLNLTSLLGYHDYENIETANSHIQVLVLVSFGLAFLAGVVGNGLVIYVVCKHGAMKTVTNLYLVNLALADLLFLCSCAPFTALSYVLPEWPFGSAMCKVVNYTNVASMVAAVMTLTAMGIDRYYAVVRPVKSRNHRTVRRTIVVLAGIWLVDLVAVIPTAIISQIRSFWDNGEQRQYCVLYFETDTRRQAYTLSLFLCFYMAPLLIIGVCYFLMAKNLWTSVKPGSLGEASERSTKSRRRIAKMVLMLVTVFAFCWLPIHCLHLRNDFGLGGYTYGLYVFGVWAHALSYMNSAINPIIYSFMSKNFQECFRAAFCCKPVTSGTVFIVVENGQRKASPGRLASCPRTSTRRGYRDELMDAFEHSSQAGRKATMEPRSPVKRGAKAFELTLLPYPLVEEVGLHQPMGSIV